MIKSRFFFVWVLFPIAIQAQISQVTETQKKQALQTVSKFCSLLSQWSNGQRTLDAQIYALCSGNDCSAYDDVTTQKETTMRNYLLGIQKKYPKSLPIQITQPTLSQCEISYEPVLTASTHVGSVSGSMDPYSMADITEVNTSFYKNAYLVFTVNQSIPSLSVSGKRRVVYDLNAAKITAYVIGHGTFISYIEGLNLMVKRDYKGAISKFNVAATNPRASLKKSCNAFAGMCCAYLNDPSGIIRYLKASGDPVYTKYSDMLQHYLDENYPASLSDLKEMERLINQSGTNIYDGFLPALYCLRAIIYSMPEEMGHNYNLAMAVSNFKKAIQLGSVQSAFMLFEAWLHNDDFEDYISETEAMKYLEWAAERGHPAAILMEGKYAEVSNDDINTTIKWYEMGAKRGDPFCMACLGKILISQGGLDVATGRNWLKKALEGDKFDEQRKAYEDLITNSFWPNSRADIQALLNSSGNSGTTSSSNTSTSSYTTNNNTSSHSNASSYSNTYTTPNASYSSNTSYSYKKPRRRRSRPFNSPHDEHNVAGWLFGYVQKSWNIKGDGWEDKGGYWDDTKCMHGFQTGLHIEPLFKYGFGIDTGLYYEFYQSKSGKDTYEGEEYRSILQEHVLYIPLHLEYRLHFSKIFQVFFYGGVGADFGLKAKLKTDNEYLSYDDDNAYHDSPWKRINTSYEFGGGICIKHVQFNFTMSRGLINMSNDNDYTIKQNKNFMCGMSLMF